MDPEAPEAAGELSTGGSPLAAGDDEHELVAAVLRRDRKAAAQFVAAHVDAVYAYARHRLAPRADLVDDVVQDVFVAALNSLATFKGASSLRGWLVGIARHKVEEVYRQRLRLPEPLDGEDAIDAESLAQPPTLDQHLDTARTRDKVQRVLAAMPERYGLMLLWRYWEQRSTREMAAAMGTTEKSVERALARARACFKDLWLKE